ncbi:MAG: lipopolysaccharide transport periplasmic protein LptA [Gammaproteobacteria bacterium]|nr:lipopolysaccharide transport periplasmic protein LptA [Gammaproteobacteria bacterium]
MLAAACGALLTAAHAAPAAQSSVIGNAATVSAPPAAASAAPATVAGSVVDHNEAEKAALAPPNPQVLRPSGPIEISADRAELSHGKTMIYLGDVKLRSDTLELDGARMQAQQSTDGQVHAVINGSPAELHHPGKGSDDPPVNAQARQLTYDSATSVVELTGDAVFSRGDNQVRGQDIRYNVSQRAVEAVGGAGGQVHIVIQPPAAASSTAPAATGATAPAAPASGGAAAPGSSDHSSAVATPASTGNPP